MYYTPIVLLSYLWYNISNMTPEQFCYWLKGYLSDKLSETQIQTIVNTLDRLSDSNSLDEQLKRIQEASQSDRFNVPYIPPYLPQYSTPTPMPYQNPVYCGDIPNSLGPQCLSGLAGPSTNQKLC